MRTFQVVANEPATWPGISDPARTVTAFLAGVRVAGDAQAAAALMHNRVLCHQVQPEHSVTIARAPAEYAAHVADMRRTFGDFAYLVTELLTEADHVYVRWQQHGRWPLVENGAPGSGDPVTQVGSAVYRVSDGRIAEYWVQLDRLGMMLQTPTAAPAAPAAPSTPSVAADPASPVAQSASSAGHP